MKAPLALLLPASFFLPLLVGMPALLHGQSHFPQSPVPEGSFTAIVAGDLDGNLTPEVAVIQGTSLIVFQNPATSGESIVVATNALDVCYWPTAGGEGAPGLLYSTPSGLTVATFVNDGFYASYDCEAIAYPLHGATRIRYALDQGQEKLFFVGSDSKSFHTAAIVAGAITGPVLRFTLVPTVLDIVLLDYLNNGSDTGLDIGILHSNGVNIRSQGNDVYLARSAMIPGDAIARVRHPSSAGMKDSLAWITRLTGELPNLLLFNPVFVTPQNPAPYVKILLSIDPSVRYASAAVADVDGDGIEDVLMGRTVSRIDVQRLGNPQTEPVFVGPLGGVDMSFPLGSPTAMGRILCANFFNEADSDDAGFNAFAAMLTDLNGLRLAHNYELEFPDDPPQLPPPYIPDFDTVTYESAMHRADDPSTPENDCLPDAPPSPPSLPRARWEINLGLGWGLFPPTNSPNYIELIVRRCPSGMTAPEPAALVHLIFEIDTSSTDGDGTGIHHTKIAFHAGTNENDADNWTTEDLNSRYFAMVRPVQLQGDPAAFKVIRAWRWSVLGMSAHCDGASWLAGRPGAGEPISISPQVCGDINNCGLGLGGGENRLPPKAVPQSSIPASSPNVLPIINDPPYNN